MKSIRQNIEIGEYNDGSKGVGLHTDNVALADVIDAFNDAGVDNEELVKQMAIAQYVYGRRLITTFVNDLNDPNFTKEKMIESIMSCVEIINDVIEKTKQYKD